MKGLSMKTNEILQNSLLRWVSNRDIYNLERYQLDIILCEHGEDMDSSSCTREYVYSNLLLTLLDTNYEFSTEDMKRLNQIAYILNLNIKKVQEIHNTHLSPILKTQVYEELASYIYDEDTKLKLNIKKNMYHVDSTILTDIIISVGSEMTENLIKKYENDIISGMKLIKNYVSALPCKLNTSTIPKYNELVRKYNAEIQSKSECV